MIQIWKSNVGLYRASKGDKMTGCYSNRLSLLEAIAEETVEFYWPKDGKSEYHPLEKYASVVDVMKALPNTEEYL